MASIVVDLDRAFDHVRGLPRLDNQGLAQMAQIRWRSAGFPTCRIADFQSADRGCAVVLADWESAFARSH